MARFETIRQLLSLTTSLGHIFSFRHAFCAILVFFSLINAQTERSICKRLFTLKLPADTGKLQWSKLVDMPIEAGEFLMLKDRTAWVASSPHHLHSIQLVRGSLKVAHIRTSRELVSDPDNLLAAKFEPEFPEGWSAEHVLGLMARLVHKELPYGPWFCNESHYMRYVIYAIRWEPRFKHACPLRRDLRGMDPGLFNSPDFYLINGDKGDNKVYVDKLPALSLTAAQLEGDAGESPPYSPKKRHRLRPPKPNMRPKWKPSMRIRKKTKPKPNPNPH